ncbi:MFS transporter [Paraburkholderia sp. ZP32-5]|uniref:MFS transporter n=1 Tax=Paraburkholderia sp. ZP32-5 TaxID=2883245 RepID=UPI001F254047|nr:MFS transporter [Paraburkholderia sp. ZP32-5]
MNDLLVAARVDRLPNSRMHREWMFLFAIPLFFDSCDINTFASAAPALVRHWHIAINEIALITSASFIGMFFGATLGGLLSDRLGRKRSLMLFVLISSLGSLATAVVPSVPYLFAARVVTGFGISAGMVTVMTYIAELFPARSRGTWQSWAMVINLCAIPLTNLVARLLVPYGPDGWRWVFVWGALGIAFPLFAKRLPESPRWSVRAGRFSDAEAALAAMEARSIAEGNVLTSPQVVARAPEPREPWTTMFNSVYRRRTFALCAIWLLQTIGFYGFEAWVPTLLVHHGITIARSLTYFTLINVGAPLGALLAVYPADRFERKHLIALVALLIAGFGLLYGLSFKPVLIVTFGFAVGMLTQTFATLLYAYTPEQFPTGVRNSATGLTYGAGRIANVANAFVIAAVYTNYGYATVFMYIAGAWFLTALITLVFGPKTTGRSLETLNPAVDAEGDTSALSPIAEYTRR